MIKKYTFSTNNNSKNFNISGCPFCNKCNKSTDYSKMLDDLIAADIKEKNPWLYGSYNIDDDYIISEPKKIKIKINSSYIDDDLENAFIFGNKKYSYNTAFNFFKNLGCLNCPFKKNVKYKLTDGTYLTITDDYIHINDEMYFFNLMDDTFFLNLNKPLKKTIATIYIDGLKINIKK